MIARVFLGRVDAAARDVERLRAQLERDSYAAHLLDRIGGHVESLALFVEPAAGELVRLGFTVEAALTIVDRRADALRHRLCPERQAA